MRRNVLVDSCQRSVAGGRWRRLRTTLILSLTIAAGVAPTRLVGETAPVAAAGTVPVTDLATHTEPVLAALPAGGGTLLDPVFQTPLMRLTDASDGSDCRVEYSYWPTFNNDSTRAKALCVINGVNRTRIWTFDPVSFTRGSSVLMPQLLQSTDPIWSHSDPHLVYGHSQSHLLLTYDVSSQTIATVKDFSSVAPAGGQLEQMSMSADDDVFAFHLTNSSAAQVGYIVWKRSTNTIVLNRTETNIDEVQIDKTGRYLTVGYRSGNNRIWDLQNATPTFTDLTWGVDGFFHHDSGRGTIFTYNGTTSGFGYRHLSAPHATATLLLATTSNKTAHMSMGADNEQWALVSHYSDNGTAAASPFDNEIFQVATDGSGKVRRIAHHRSVFNDYYDAPLANISRDGRLVAFSSNWGNANGRRDVFVAHIVAAPVAGTSPQAPAAPTNVRILAKAGG